MYGLFGGAAGRAAGRMATALDGGKGGYSQDPKIRQRAGLMDPMREDEEERRRRGLFGRIGDMFSQDALSQTNAAGVTRGEQLGAMLMSLAGPQQQAQAMNMLGNARARGDEERRLAEAQREEREQSKLAGVQADQERQQEIARLYALEDQFGLDRGALSMLPAEARDGVISELAARRFTPEEPDLPSSVREYEYARQQGFRGSFQDWQAANPRGTNVSVNTGAQPNTRPSIGSIPQGFQARYDEQAGSYVYEPIPGSDPAQERQNIDRAAQESQNRDRQYAGIAIDEIGRSLGILDENPRAGGFVGGMMQHVDGTLSNELEGLYDTIGGYIARDTLQGMRESSPTGGALGQVTERELAMLRAAYGAIRVGDRPETQRYNLMRLNNMLMDVVHGAGQGPGRASLESAEGRGGLTEAERRELEELERRFGGR